MPFRIQVRFVRKDKDEVMEDSIYLGEIPIMIGGGEFIINGAERVIVNQLHRSPGVDFLVEVQEGDRPLHGCRIIPERGSWIECSVTKKDALAVRIDQSSKIPATTFLRALDKKYSTTEVDHQRVLHDRERQGGAASGRLTTPPRPSSMPKAAKSWSRPARRSARRSTRSRRAALKSVDVRDEGQRSADPQHAGRRHRRES